MKNLGVLVFLVCIIGHIMGIGISLSIGISHGIGRGIGNRGTNTVVSVLELPYKICVFWHETQGSYRFFSMSYWSQYRYWYQLLYWYHLWYWYQLRYWYWYWSYPAKFESSGIKYLRGMVF